ncbi:Proteophosphoglycan ppg4 [Rhodotorula toruloides ATCC 204091]|uniref:BY PROTMAP: gi/342318978/gb/EGU10930.1/ Proteophosphoglycan ppg4 [Rhodotorula glutinis ATCC 204091] n=1 Tax=Rhodotorula toruloides TaxID=5286 RepID=A0A0K3CPA3_RHOTO|nr:Proteophosphoglycan ppg4 [Rhodotorula toruloides ATCC 204091]
MQPAYRRRWTLIALCILVATILQYRRASSDHPPALDAAAAQLAVVMPFTAGDAPKVAANLRLWDDFPPCLRSLSHPKPSFYFYANKLPSNQLTSEVNTAVAALPSSVKRCFQDFHLINAEIPPELDHYDPDARDSSWVAGPNEQFYQLMSGNLTAPGTTHIFMMEPDTRPVQPGWLNQLAKVVAESEPFWVRGSAFRPDCAQRKTSHTNAADDCHQLGAEIADHINGNALYNIGDPAFGEFLDAVRASTFGKWPFDLAWMRYIRSPEKEALRRRVLKNFVYTDLIQNLGPQSFALHVFRRDNPWTFFVHSDAAGHNGTEPLDLSGSKELVLSPLADNPLQRTLLPALKLVANSKTNNVMLAFGTSNYLDLVRNFVHFVREAGIDNFVLIAMDADTVAWAEEEKVPYYSYIDEEVATLGGSDSYKSDGFRRVVNRRCSVISTALRGGFNILQSDLDVIWVKNPFPYFFNGDYEYEIQSDGRRGFTERDPAAPFRDFVNSGLFYARGTPRMADFYDILIRTVAENPHRREQHLLNTILQENVLRIHYRILDPTLFPNGFQYFARALPTRAGVEPFCIHNNWVDGKYTKEYRFREIGMWTQDPPEYYDTTERKYLAFYDPSTPNNGWNNQRNSLRAALAIAKILGRTLILPHFYSHHGKPVVVTLDYFLDYDTFSTTFPDFRESYFLDLVFPDPPERIFHIDIGPSSLGPLPKGVPLVTFKAKGEYRGATDREIETWFEPYQDEPLIRLSSAFRRFHKFVDPVENKAFNDLLYTGLTPAPFIRNTASFIAKKLTEAAEQKHGSPKFNCAHIRRGDFPSVHKGEKTTKELAQMLGTMMDKDRVTYITSDESGSYPFRDVFRQQFPQVHFWPEYNRPWFEHLYDDELGESMRVGAVEQRVCAWADKFVGNIYSTFTTHVCYLRTQLGRTGDSVCPDIYVPTMPCAPARMAPSIRLGYHGSKRCVVFMRTCSKRM